MAVTTAAAFDAAVLRRCLWPAENAPLSQDERLRIANEEISGELFPRIIAAHADYYLSTLDHDITATFLRYRMPRKHFGPIRDLRYLTAEDVAAGREGVNVNVIDIGELGRRTDCGLVAFVDGDFIGLDPVPEETLGTLRMRFYREPNALTLEGLRVGTVSLPSTIAVNDDERPSISTPAGTVEVAATTFVPAADDELDIISDGNAHQVLCDQFTVDNFALGAILFEESLEGLGVQAGDWISAHGYTPIVPLPSFMVSAAVRQVAAACLRAHGDVRSVAEASDAQRQFDLAMGMTGPRVQDEPPVTRTRYTPFRQWARR